MKLRRSSNTNSRIGALKDNRCNKQLSTSARKSICWVKRTLNSWLTWDRKIHAMKATDKLSTNWISWGRHTALWYQWSRRITSRLRSRRRTRHSPRCLIMMEEPKTEAGLHSDQTLISRAFKTTTDWWCKTAWTSISKEETVMDQNCIVARAPM